MFAEHGPLFSQPEGTSCSEFGTLKLYLALSGDGDLAISDSADVTVRVWDLENDHPLHVLECPAGNVHAVALSADGKRAVCGLQDHTVQVWDLEGNQPPRTLEVTRTGSLP